ncbi:MAG: chromate transporter [Chloroflexi bacterium]|nr:chromate transporter [Chloroflexota bacterium]
MATIDLTNARCELRPLFGWKPGPTVRAVATVFSRVSLLSFGGGSAVQLLLREELVRKQEWFEESEFVRLWQLAKLSLGINILGQAILYGWRLAGVLGVTVACIGLMVPAAIVTVAMSMGLMSIVGNPYVQDALRLVIPVTGGMTLAMALQMWSPRIEPDLRSRLRVGVQALFVGLSAFLVGVVKVPVPFVLLGALVAGALIPL